MGASPCDGLVLRLVAGVPDLKRLHDEHLFNNETLLPHLFMGDVTRYVTAAFGVTTEDSSCTGTQEDGVKVLGILEDAMASRDPAVEEMISVSFLENIDWAAPGSEIIRSALGPLLRAEQMRREDYYL